jgi:hypothetical protein
MRTGIQGSAIGLGCIAVDDVKVGAHLAIPLHDGTDYPFEPLLVGQFFVILNRAQFGGRRSSA